MNRELLIEGVVSVVLGGVGLFINTDDEEAHITTRPGFDMNDLRSIALVAKKRGYEPMPEWEAPVEEYLDGSVRHWLAEIVFEYIALLEVPVQR